MAPKSEWRSLRYESATETNLGDRYNGGVLNGVTRAQWPETHEARRDTQGGTGVNDRQVRIDDGALPPSSRPPPL